MDIGSVRKISNATGVTANAAKATKDYETPYGVTENDFQDWLGYGSARRQREYDYYMAANRYNLTTQDLKNSGLNVGLMFGSADAPSGSGIANGSSGKGVGVISSIAGLLFGGAKMMQASHSMALDKAIAKNVMNTAKNITQQRTPPAELAKLLQAQRERYGINI